MHDHELPRVRGVRPPQQARSLKTYHRILDATEELMALRPFDQITLNDIVDTAAVSSSSIYARFRTKDLILHSVFERFVDRATDAVADGVAIAAERAEGADPADQLDELAHALIQHFVGFVVEHEELVRIMATDPRLFNRRWEIEEAVAGAARGLTLPALATTTDVDDTTSFRVEFIMRVIASATQRAFGPPAFWASSMDLDPAGLAREFTRLAVPYLRGSPST